MESEIEHELTASPRAVQIIHSEADHKFSLDVSALEQLLLDDDIRDRHVVVVSVAGAFRKGKSFILDFFLRYMKHKYAGEESTNKQKVKEKKVEKEDEDEDAEEDEEEEEEEEEEQVEEDINPWLGPEDMPLDGFSWRGGSERDTTGILMWSQIFRATLPNNEKVAIILLDTQGTFDSESTVRDCATVFALSTMISSLQIYNLSQNIQEDDLQHLQLFTEYGRLALADSGEKPFQKLQFLVRDWCFPYEAEYGTNGGQKILDRRLQISNKQHPELQSIRKHIRSCFSEISCFLMPHPGLRVATNPNFDGRLSEIEQDFKNNLGDFIPMLLAPENLIVKKINGHKVKAKELLQYFQSYINIYSGDELPEPKSMLVATAEANNLAAVAAAKETYHFLMEIVCGGAKPYLNSAHLDTEHLRIKEKAMEQFSKKRKMGGEEFSETYRVKLDSDLEDLYSQFKLYNESKNIFKAARTPAVFFSIAVTFYILSGILGLLGIYFLANLCNLIMGAALVTLVTWSYVRYSGDFLEIGEKLDEMAHGMWENVMKPLCQIAMQKSIERAMSNQSISSMAHISSTNGKLKLS